MAQKLGKGRKGVWMNAKSEINKLTPLLDRGDVSDRLVDVERSIGKLSDYRKRLQDIHNEMLEVITDDKEEDKEVEYAARMDEELLDLIHTAKAMVNASQREAPPNQMDASLLERGSNTATVKLPKLDLPKFDGDPLMWQEFWDCFKCTVDEQDGLSGVSKFKYLKASLEGSALRLAEGYRLTEANYTAVVAALQERFGNPQLAVFSHLSAMLDIAPASHDLSQLRTVYDDCERHIRSLVALGLAEETFGQVFTPMILSKLPTFVKMELHRKNGDQPWTLSNLRSLLKEEIRVRDMSERQFGPGQQRSRKGSGPQAKQKEFKQSSARSSAAVLSTHQASKVGRGSCPFCGNAHTPESCQKYTSPKARKLRARGRCFVCLQVGHMVSDCKDTKSCVHCGKAGSHHSSLCMSWSKPKHETAPGGGRGNQPRPSVATQMNPNASSFVPGNSLAVSGVPRREANMQTAIADVYNVDGVRYAPARLVFDTAGFRSYITSDLVKAIGAKVVDKDPVGLAVFGSQRRKYCQYDVVEFDVETSDGQTQRVVADVTPSITLPVTSHAIDVESHPCLKSLPLAESLTSSPKALPIDVLIGADYYYDFVSGEVLRLGDGLVLVSSSLGYLVGGCSSFASSKGRLGSVLLAPADNNSWNFDLERFWKLETVGIMDEPETVGDDQALSQFSESVQFREGRYHVRWPWKIEHPELSDNFGLAYGRLRSLLRQLRKNPDVLSKYDGVISEQMQLGIIEKAPDVPTGPLVHHIPHHCVIRPDKATTKIRIVYDASAKTCLNDLSLNDCIYRGPVLLNDLVGILLRFRMVNVALVADIEKAFLQITLQETERDVTRFLWVKDVSKPVSSSNLVVYRFKRVLFGNVASPFLLGATVHHHLRQYDEPTAKLLMRDNYVDNVVSGQMNVQSARVFYTRSKAMFQEMSMNLREWFSNDQEFLSSVDRKDQGVVTANVKVLGVGWDSRMDTLHCDVRFAEDAQPTTKRGILQMAAKLFDPLGLYVPITATAKMMLQEAWKKKYDWDEPLPKDVLDQFQEFHTSIKEMRGHTVSRLVVGPTVQGCRIQLHCFVDASAKAYAASLYLRMEETGSTYAKTGLLMSKCRVSPVKPLSIPKLELMALVIGTKLLDFARNELDTEVEASYLWSDSQCVLHWVTGNRVQTPFVRNRVKQISRVRNIVFRYVPTEENPADIASRGSTFANLAAQNKWWHGPPWLSERPEKWPSVRIGQSATQVRDAVNDVTPAAVLTAQQEPPVVDIGRFSTAANLHRVVAWCLRFANNARSNPANRTTGVLCAKELQEAQLKMMRLVQTESFNGLLSGTPTAKDKLLTRQLQLYIADDGLLRSSGRLKNATVPDGSKDPVVMPKNHPYTRLLILEAHAEMHHAGVPHTLAFLRQSVWVVHGRAQVKAVLRECKTCKVLKAKPFATPKFPPLPDFRVQGVAAFNVAGLDYLGPLIVKHCGVDKKVWICLFTCAAVRAIHLEVVMSLTAEQFLLALRRFGSLYDYPSVIVSDNARTFKAAKTCIDKVWRSDKVQNFATGKGITWKFITERAPWMGGFYERLVGLTKNALRSCLHFRKVDAIELQTICYEVSSTLNNRPLLYVDSGDPAMLCPANFLLKGTRRTETQLDADDGEDLHADDLVTKWRRIQATLQSFWETWSKQYLLGLREYFTQRKARGSSDVKPEVGMTVIVRSDAPRGQWKLGRIMDLKESSDGVIRSATVRVASGLINRPVKSLCPLEASVETPVPDGDPEVPQTAAIRPMRAAAMNARQKVRQQLADESDDE